MERSGSAKREEQQMKKIGSLVAASLLALATPSVAAGVERWGWSDLAAAQSWKEARIDIAGANWQPIGDMQKHAGTVSGLKVDVVPVPLDPKLVKEPGVLAALAPGFDDALAAIRKAVASDPAVNGRLEAEGYKPDDVIGFGKLKDGTVAVFVDSAG
jgi:hypothetical protein